MTEPITVTEAISALEREIAVCDEVTKGPWKTMFLTHARNGYRGALEYIHGNLTRFGCDLLMEGDQLYAAVAPIVERWRKEGKP